jgi:hypothetical protein
MNNVAVRAQLRKMEEQQKSKLSITLALDGTGFTLVTNASSLIDGRPPSRHCDGSSLAM